MVAIGLGIYCIIKAGRVTQSLSLTFIRSMEKIHFRTSKYQMRHRRIMEEHLGRDKAIEIEVMMKYEQLMSNIMFLNEYYSIPLID